MSRRVIFFVVNIAVLATVAYLFLPNTEPVVLNIMGSALHCTGGALLFGTYALGFVICFLSGLPMLGNYSQAANIAKLKEWQGQDAKLLKEIQSDKEKQLEAKIATLEAALKQALKR